MEALEKNDESTQWHGARIISEKELAFTSDARAKRKLRTRHGVVMGVLLALVLAAAAGALLVFSGIWDIDGSRRAAPAEPQRAQIANAQCPEVDLQYLDPASVKVRVLNATEQAGLAGSTAQALEKRGFTITSVSSGWDEYADSVGAVIAGPQGYDAALTVQRQVPGAVFVYDESKHDDRVDLAVGAQFTSLEKERKLNLSPGRLSCAP